MSDPEFPDDATRNVLVPGCARCPALAAARECIAWGNGPAAADGRDASDEPPGATAPEDADVVVVGEAPAAGVPEADRWQGGNHTGLAYTSRHSGRRIRALFAAIGYDPYYTNAVKCFPRDPDAPTDAPTNREPTPAERERCAGHLRTELAQVDPAVVVPTGKHATRSVLSLAGRDVDGFLDAVLDPVRCESLGVAVVPILHPSYQDVWVARLGYDEAGYRAAIAATLDELV